MKKWGLWCFAMMFFAVCTFGILLPVTQTEIATADTSEQAVSYTLPAQLDGLFTDYTMTRLSGQYGTMEKLTEFESWIDPTNQYKVFFDRARAIIRGDVRYEKDREFSSKFADERKIDQFGNLYTYSMQNLKFGFGATDIQVTGIYGLVGQKISVFVDPATKELPEILLAQCYGTYQTYRHTVKLSRGFNTFNFFEYSANVGQPNGGAIYIINNFTEAQQGEVSLYIEGGGYYPVFRKDGDEKKFLSSLKEYEERRETYGLLDMAELITDNAIITTTSSSLYKAYIERKIISPQLNLQLWAEYMHKTFEFNGIPLDESSAYRQYYNELNTHVNLNFRYLHMFSGANAFAFYRLIAFVNQHNWFANFNDYTNPIDPNNVTDTRWIFDVGHEIGHVLDVSNRTFAETTNNVNGSFAYLQLMGFQSSRWTPFTQAHEHLQSDYTNDYLAYDDGNVLYVQTENDSYHDHNHMMWYDLESVFPGYWGRLNNYFRYDALGSYINPNEQMVYYSSLATGVNLSDYFERWGMFMIQRSVPMARYEYSKSSAYFKNLMNQAIADHIIENKDCAHYWYVDSNQYKFSIENGDRGDKSYQGTAPVITSINISNENSKNVRYVSFTNSLDENHLCYEVYSSVNDKDYYLAGFSYSTSFRDEYQYSSTPYYKVRAVNRFFECTSFSPAQFTATNTVFVASVGDQNFGTLKEAIEFAQDGDTIYLLDNCSLDSKELYKSLTIKISPTVNRDIRITATDSSSVFRLNDSTKTYTFEGHENAQLVFEGGGRQRYYGGIFLGYGTLKLTYVTMQNWSTSLKNYGSAIYGLNEYTNIIIENSKIINCSGGNGAIETSGKVSIENCQFENNVTDLYIKKHMDEQVTFVNATSKMSIGYSDVSKNSYFVCQNFVPDESDLQKLSTNSASFNIILDKNGLGIGQYNYVLTFKWGQKRYTYTLTSKIFIFGQEILYDSETGEEYHLDEGYYISKYMKEGTTDSYSNGDTITLTEDMTFWINTSQKNSILLQLYSRVEIFYVLENEMFFLPRYDQDMVITEWDVEGKTYSAGELCEVKHGDRLKPVYVGYYRFEYYLRDQYLGYGYQQYGTAVKTPQVVSSVDLYGWFLDGEFINPGETFILDGDRKLYAALDGKAYNLDECEIALESEEFEFTGAEIFPNITVTVNGEVVPDYYYKIRMTNNKNVGTATIEITPAIDLAQGSKTKTFLIKAANLNESNVMAVGLGDFAYTGEEISPRFTLKWKEYSLVEEDDYTVSSYGQTNVGKVDIFVTFKGNFVGQAKFSYNIVRANVPDFRVHIEGWTFGEAPNMPTFSVSKFEEEIRPYVSFSYSSNNTVWVEAVPENAGTYFVRAMIAESQNFNASTSQSYQFLVRKAQISEYPLSRYTVPYNVSNLEEVDLPHGWVWETPHTELVYGEHQYVAKWSDQQNYVGNYTANVIVERNLRPISLVRVQPLAENPVYTGSPIEPELVLTEGDTQLFVNKDYKIEFKNNINAGNAIANIMGFGIYTGSIDFNFVIEQAEMPFGLPEKVIYSRTALLLEDVKLPSNWEWENPKQSVQGLEKARIKYTNLKDIANFKKTSFEVVLELKKLVDIAQAVVKMEGSRYAYTGIEIMPIVELTYGDEVLVEGRDYRIEYKNNKDVGAGQIFIYGLNDYEGTVVREFEIYSTNYLSTPWYVIMIPVAVLAVVVLALLFVSINRNRRRRKMNKK